MAFTGGGGFAKPLKIDGEIMTTLCNRYTTHQDACLSMIKKCDASQPIRIGDKSYLFQDKSHCHTMIAVNFIPLLKKGRAYDASWQAVKKTPYKQSPSKKENVSHHLCAQTSFAPKSMGNIDSPIQSQTVTINIPTNQQMMPIAPKVFYQFKQDTTEQGICMDYAISPNGTHIDRLTHRICTHGQIFNWSEIAFEIQRTPPLSHSIQNISAIRFIHAQ